MTALTRRSEGADIEGSLVSRPAYVVVAVETVSHRAMLEGWPSQLCDGAGGPLVATAELAACEKAWVSAKGETLCP